MCHTATHGITVQAGGGANVNVGGLGRARTWPANTLNIPDIDALVFTPYGSGKERATVTMSFTPNANWGGGGLAANNLYIVFERDTGGGTIDPSIPIEDTISVNQSLRLAARMPLATPTVNIVWASDDEGIAIVDGNGVVTGISEGMANITITDVDDALNYRRAEITVDPIAANYLEIGWNYTSHTATTWSAMLRAPMDYIVISENQTLFVGVGMAAQGNLAQIQGAGVGWTNANVQNWFIDVTEGIIIDNFVRYAPGDNARMSITVDYNALDINFAGQPYEIVYLRPRPFHASAQNWGGANAFVPASPLAIKVLNPAYGLVLVNDVTLNYADYTLAVDGATGLGGVLQLSFEGIMPIGGFLDDHVLMQWIDDNDTPINHLSISGNPDGNGIVSAVGRVRMTPQGAVPPIPAGTGQGWGGGLITAWFRGVNPVGSALPAGITIPANVVRDANIVSFTVSADHNDIDFAGQPFVTLQIEPQPHGPAQGWPQGSGNTASFPAASLTVRVYAPSEASGNGTGNGGVLDSTVQLVATIAPDDATIDTVAWGSSNDEIATVDQTGLVTGAGDGVATIVARSVQNPTAYATAEITVIGEKEPYVPVTGISLMPAVATINLGQELYSPNAEPTWWGTPNPTHPFWIEQDYSTLPAPVHTIEWVTDRVWLAGEWDNVNGTWADTGVRGDTIYVRPGQTTTVSIIYSAENVIQPNTFSVATNHNPDGTHIFWSTPNTGPNTFFPALFTQGEGSGNFTTGQPSFVGSARGFRTQHQTFGYYFRVGTVNITPTATLNALVAAEGPQTIALNAVIPVGQVGTQDDWRPTGHFRTNDLYIVVDPDAPAIGSDQPSGNSVSNNTVRLNATLQPADATNRDIIWTSSNPAIASVDNNGVVTGHTQGVVTITARADGDTDVFATSTITVIDDTVVIGPNMLPGRTITHQFILQHSLDLFAGGTTDYMDAFFYSKPDHLIPSTEDFDFYVARIENGPRAQGRNLNITWSSSNTDIVTIANSDALHPNRGILTPVGILPQDVARGYSYATITATVNVNGQNFSASTQVRVYQPNGTDIVYLSNISHLGTVPAAVRVLAISGGNLTNAQIQTIRAFTNLRELYIIGTATVPNNASAGNINAGFRGIGFNPEDPINPDPTRGDLRRLVIYNTTHFGNDYFRDSVSLEYLYLRHAIFKGTRVIAMPQHSQSSRLHTVRAPQLEHITFRTWYYNTVLSTLELGPQALHIERPAANAGLWFSFSSLADVMREVWPDKPYHMTIYVPDYAAFREFARMETDVQNPGPFLPGQLNEEIAWVVLPFRTLNGENLPEIETHPPFVDEVYNWLQEYYRVDLPFDTRQIPLSLNFFTFAQHLTVQNSWWRPVAEYYQYVESMGGDINNFVIPVTSPGPPDGLTILDVITWAAQAGYEGIDVTGYYLEGYQGMRVQTPQEQAHMLYQAREIRRYADLLGIEITGTGFGNSFTDANPERIAMDLERYKFFMHVADAMGAPVVRVFAGNVPADEIQLGWNHIIDNRLIPVLVELSQYIDANGFDIQLGIQNHGDVIATENQALYLIHQLNNLGITNIGLVQDTGFWRGYQSLQSNFYDWYHAIQTTLPISVNFQLKKKPAGAGTAAGWLDLDRVFRDIRLSGYEGTVPIELLWGGAGIDNDLHLSPDPRITWDNIAVWEAQFGRSTAQHVANEAEWFMELASIAERRSLDSNMDIASIAGVSEIAIIPTNRTVTSPLSGNTRQVYGRGTAADPRVREVSVNVNSLDVSDIVTAHPGATVTLYANAQFGSSVSQVTLNPGANDVFVRVVSANQYMYDFPRDADGNPTWEQQLRPGLESGFLTVRRPIAEETFYRVNVITTLQGGDNVGNDNDNGNVTPPQPPTVPEVPEIPQPPTDGGGEQGQDGDGEDRMPVGRPSTTLSQSATPAPTPQPAPQMPPQQSPPLAWIPGLNPPAVSPAFNDVDQNAWYANYVALVTAAGVFAGVGEGQFNPSGAMTRAMFVQVLANLDGTNLQAFVGTTPSFTDVSPDAWYFAAVEWAASLGIVEGMGDGTFGADTPITREQLAVMLFRFIQIMGIEVPMGAAVSVVFTDLGAISSWAAEAVAAIQAMGIISGRPDGSFDPQATATRSEVAAIFARFLELVQ